MNIRQLQVFQAVCRELSFTGAAKSLYMTQPAVSHMISSLEAETGCVLFDRIARRIYLTEAGKTFLDKATRILELYGDLTSDACGAAHPAPIRLGSSITIANFLLPSLLREFAGLCSAPVRVEVDSARNIQKRLMDNEIDAALVEGVIPHKQLVKFPFSSFTLTVVCSPSYPLAKKGPVPIDALVREPLLLREKGSAIRDAFDSVLLLKHLSAEGAWTSVNSQALIEAAKNGLGVSILPEILIKNELAAGTLTQLCIEGFSLENTNYIVYHRDKYLTQPLQAFIGLVKQKEKNARTDGSSFP